MKLAQIAEKIGIEVDVEIGQMEITGVNSLRHASAGELSFLSQPKYSAELSTTRASAVLVSEDVAVESAAKLLFVENPDKVFAQVALMFYQPPVPQMGIHPSAVVEEGAQLAAGVSVGANATIEASARIGSNTTIGANSYIGEQVVIGKEVLIHPLVTLREGTQLGDRVIIHSGTVLGSDGFGYTQEPDGSRRKIPQIGRVVVEDDVEIGANVAVDRARFGKTLIGRGTKVDNLVQIAHNVEIEEDCVLCGQVGIAGSAQIGAKTILAGQVGVNGHIRVGEQVIVHAKSGVINDTEDGAQIMGMPAVESNRFKKAYAGMLQLTKLRTRVKQLEKRSKISFLLNKQK